MHAILIMVVMTAADLRAQVPQSSSYSQPAWGWNQGGCGGGTGAHSSSNYGLIDSLAPPMISMGTTGLPYLSDTNYHCYSDVLFCVLRMEALPTPTPNYLELRVRANASGGYDFNPDETLVLEWTTYQDRYGFTNVPCAIYLGASMTPPGTDTVVSVAEIVNNSGALFLFDNSLRASRYAPGNVSPTWSGVSFPLPVTGSSGTVNFRVPGGAAGSWAFAAAFVRLDGGGFPADPPVEVSNGFILH